jgi:hypothetical protein
MSAPGGVDKCECPECGYEADHERGIPCRSMKCPKCGSTMIAKVDNDEEELSGSQEYGHIAARQNPRFGRGPAREVSYDPKSGGPVYCVCSKCGTRTIKKVGLACSAVKCIKCGSPMAEW